MEEKERYITLSDRQIKDTYNNSQYFMSIKNVCKILNQQDKRIKELEQENLSLQEQSIRDNQNWIEETTKLKQHLYDLPNKIVEEIKEKLHDRLSKIAGYGRMTTDEFSFFVENEFTKDIDTILKKYGEE